MSTFHDDFDYENAKRDIWENGGDPDYLTHRDPAERDAFLKDMGLNPKDYGSKWKDSGSSGNGSNFWDELDDFAYDLDDATSSRERDPNDYFDDEDYDPDEYYDEDIDPDEYYAEGYHEYDDYDSLKGGSTYKKPKPQPQTETSEEKTESEPEVSEKMSKAITWLIFFIVIIPILIGIAFLLFSCAKMGIQDKAPFFVIASIIGAVIVGYLARGVIKDLFKKK